jgi:NAD(P)H-hydrate epimerase
MSVSVATIQNDRIRAARSLAEKHDITVVLKGAGTVIAHPDGKVFVNPTGNPGMAAGGMGDVLTGLIAGLITQGFDPDHAAHAGVFLHGMAADRLARRKGPAGYLASEVMEQIPVVSADLLRDRHPQVMGVDTLAYRLP